MRADAENAVLQQVIRRRAVRVAGVFTGEERESLRTKLSRFVHHAPKEADGRLAPRRVGIDPMWLELSNSGSRFQLITNLLEHFNESNEHRDFRILWSDRSSWAKTKRTVQASLNAATPTGGDVWVAAGTYVETVTVPLGVSLYGGFAGSELTVRHVSWLEPPGIRWEAFQFSTLDILAG